MSKRKPPADVSDLDTLSERDRCFLFVADQLQEARLDFTGPVLDGKDREIPSFLENVNRIRKALEEIAASLDTFNKSH